MAKQSMVTNLFELLNYIISNLNLSLLDIIALVLLLVHFGVPLSYYYYMKKKWLNAPWNMRVDPNYKPKVTIIIPTYNEGKFIEKKLDNIYQQDYPRDKLEIIVVDSASIDGTPQLVKQWKQKHADINLKLIKEPVRRGKARALNKALEYATGEIIIITDVDALWVSRNTLGETIKWFNDQIVGAVSCLKRPAGKGVVGIEEGYRQYYNILRLAESKVWSTPVFHGELSAFRKELLDELGGFPIDIGADDSHTATRIALMGYRAITPETIWCVESVPQGKDYHSWRIRRAQHLIQHFNKIFSYKHNAPKMFKRILYAEMFLHVLNPWLLLIAVLLLILSALGGSLIALISLGLGMTLLIHKPYRTWIITQLYLAIALIRNVNTRNIVWEKNAKHNIKLEHYRSD